MLLTVSDGICLCSGSDTRIENPRSFGVRPDLHVTSTPGSTRLEIFGSEAALSEAKMKTLLKWSTWIGLVSAALACAPNIALAQGNGRISGTVTDTSGAVVPGADVRATQTSTGLVLSTVTSGEGTFVFPSLLPSVYDISVSATGFSNYTEKGAQLRADNALTVNIVLQAGSTTQTVTVNAQAAQVDTTTGTLNEVIGTSQLNNLPLNGRNAASLTAEVAGVSVAPSAQADQGNTKTFPVAFTITANGTRVGQ